MEQQSQASRRWRAFGQTGRWLILLAAIAFAWPLRTGSSSSVLLPALSPLVAAAAAISARTIGLLALLAVPVLVLAMIQRRWFCRYGCPVGLLQELVQRTRPSARARWLHWPAVGPTLALLALGGALLGYPLLLWLDPLAIFNGFLNAWRRPLALATLLTGLGLPLLLLLELAIPRLWCRRICPLGASQDLLIWLRKALSPARPDRSPANPSAAPARRGFLAACAAAAGALSARAVRGHNPPPLRPPGALGERQFMGTCVRCGNCAQACPAGIIQPDFGDAGIFGLLAPRLRFDADYCREDCNWCNQVCPSSAIARLSLADKRARKIGQAVVNLDLCLLAEGRECTACIQKCPYDAIEIQSPDGGFSTQPGVILGPCNGCGACEVVCPTRPVPAIQVKNIAG